MWKMHFFKQIGSLWITFNQYNVEFTIDVKTHNIVIINAKSIS